MAGEIIYRGLLAELELPLVLVAARALVKLGRLFGEKGLRVARTFQGTGIRMSLEV